MKVAVRNGGAKHPIEVGKDLGVTPEAINVVSKLGVPTADEVARLLEPHGQTVRGTGVGGATAAEDRNPPGGWGAWKERSKANGRHV